MRTGRKEPSSRHNLEDNKKERVNYFQWQDAQDEGGQRKIRTGGGLGRKVKLHS